MVHARLTRTRAPHPGVAPLLTRDGGVLLRVLVARRSTREEANANMTRIG